jgi:hypothetical protein
MIMPGIQGSGLVHLALSGDVTTWIAVILTLCIFSYLYKDNPLFKLAEHLFAGVASAYVFCTQWHNVVKPNLVDPALAAETAPGERALLVVPAFLCLCMLTRIIPKWGWVSRWALAFIIGFYAGTNIPHFLETNVVKQIESTWEQPLAGEGADAMDVAEQSAKNGIFILGVICVLTFFYFSLPHTGKLGRPVGVLSRIGRYFMMVAFGATFANAVMGRVSVLIGSLTLLLRDWLGLAS